MLDSEQIKECKEVYADIHQKVLVYPLADGVIFHLENNSVGHNMWFGVKEMFFSRKQLEAVLKYLQAEIKPLEKISLSDFEIAKKFASETWVTEHDEKMIPKIVCIDAKLYQIENEGTNVSST